MFEFEITISDLSKERKSPASNYIWIVKLIQNSAPVIIIDSLTSRSKSSGVITAVNDGCWLNV